MIGSCTPNKTKTEVSFLHLFPYLYVSFVRSFVSLSVFKRLFCTLLRTKETYIYGKRCRKETSVLLLFDVPGPVIVQHVGLFRNIQNDDSLRYAKCMWNVTSLRISFRIYRIYVSFVRYTSLLHTHTHAHTHTHRHAHTHTHTHTNTRSKETIMQILTLTAAAHTHSEPPPLTHTHKHIHPLYLSLTRTHTRARVRAHTQGPRKRTCKFSP